jgi:transcriptional regulator with XRE-family HTH domain
MLGAMTDRRVGAAFRAVRVRKQLRQEDLATEAKVSRHVVSLIERGHLDKVSLPALRRVAQVLEIGIEFRCDWRGGELDRLLNARHSALENGLSAMLLALDGWQVIPEASFSIYGERGWIDVLAWHQPTRTLLVIEIKTEIVDVQQIIGLLDRKIRLAPKVARERAWNPVTVGSWLVVAEGSTNRRHVSKHGAVLRAAFPNDGASIKRWLRQPAGKIAALSFFPYERGANAKHGLITTKRVRKAPAKESQA